MRRKQSSTLQQPPPEIREEVFSVDDPRLSGMKVVSGEDVINSDDAMYSKLRAWLVRHPEVKPMIAMHMSTGEMDTKYHELRQFAIRSQIREGFGIVKRYEEYAQRKPVFDGCKLAKLRAGRKPGWTAYQNLYVAHLCDRMVHGIVCEVMNKLKATALRMISLLSSFGAIPLDHVAIGDFGRLDVTEAAIGEHGAGHEFLGRAKNLRDEAKGEMIIDEGTLQSYKALQLDDCAAGWLTDALLLCKNGFDDVERWDTAVFMDFMTYTAEETLSGVTNGQGFREKVNSVADRFQIVGQDDRLVLNVLMSEGFGSKFAPVLAADGTGGEDDEMLGYGLELFAESGPICLLKIIAKHVRDGDAKVAVEEADRALALITAGHRDVIRFVDDYTIVELMPMELKTVKIAIGQFLES